MEADLGCSFGGVLKYTLILKAVESEIRRLRQILQLLQHSTTDIFEPESTLPKQCAAEGASKLKWRPPADAAHTAKQWAERFQPWVASSNPAAEKNRNGSSEPEEQR